MIFRRRPPLLAPYGAPTPGLQVRVRAAGPGEASHSRRSLGGGLRPAPSAAARGPGGAERRPLHCPQPSGPACPTRAALQTPPREPGRAATTHYPWRRLGRPGGAQRPRRCVRWGPAAQASEPATDALRPAARRLLPGSRGPAPLTSRGRWLPAQRTSAALPWQLPTLTSVSSSLAGRSESLLGQRGRGLPSLSTCPSLGSRSGGLLDSHVWPRTQEPARVSIPQVWG